MIHTVASHPQDPKQEPLTSMGLLGWKMRQLATLTMTWTLYPLVVDATPIRLVPDHLEWWFGIGLCLNMCGPPPCKADESAYLGYGHRAGQQARSWFWAVQYRNFWVPMLGLVTQVTVESQQPKDGDVSSVQSLQPTPCYPLRGQIGRLPIPPTRAQCPWRMPCVHMFGHLFGLCPTCGDTALATPVWRGCHPSFHPLPLGQLIHLLLEAPWNCNAKRWGCCEPLGSNSPIWKWKGHGCSYLKEGLIQYIYKYIYIHIAIVIYIFIIPKYIHTYLPKSLQSSAIPFNCNWAIEMLFTCPFTLYKRKNLVER